MTRFRRAEAATAAAIVCLVATAAWSGDGDARRERIAENERRAVEALKQIAAAQAAFQASEPYGQPIGRFGMFRELSGAAPVGGYDGTGGSVAVVPRLPPAFREMNSNFEVLRSGYLFRMFLPGASGIGVGETAGTLAFTAPLDLDLARTTWCCYAWPKTYSRSGRQSFFVNQDGVITSTEDIVYWESGAFAASVAGRAFQAGGPVGSITGAVAVGTVGRDGERWQQVPARPVEVMRRVHGVLTGVGASRGRRRFQIESHDSFTETTSWLRVGGFRTLRGAVVLVIDRTGDRELRRPIYAPKRFWTDRFDPKRFVRYRDDSGISAYDGQVYLGVGDPPLTDFGGGTIEIRSKGVTLWRGCIPEFAAPGVPRTDSSATVHADALLDPATAGSSARGDLDAKIETLPHGTRERLEVTVTDSGGAAGPFTVVAIAEDSAETVLGTVTRTQRIAFDLRRAGVVPTAFLASFAGQRVEVRAADGTPVLVGTFPALE